MDLKKLFCEQIDFKFGITISSKRADLILSKINIVKEKYFHRYLRAS